MKQLKFMLAAATAISLATAAQAGVTDTKLVEEYFNGYSTDMVGAAITNVTTGIEGFSFKGTEGDNESAIVPNGDNNMALKVNTGTDPLLRALDYDDKANDVNLADGDFNYLTIDTMVQFTVTPVDDEVTAKTGDKLMIYLKEVPEVKDGDEVVSAATTKLMVKAAKYSEADNAWVDGGDDYEVTLPQAITSVTAGTWYRLIVKTKAYAYGFDEKGVANSWWPVFQIYLASASDNEINEADLCKIGDIDGAGYAVAGIDPGDDDIDTVFVSLAVTALDGEGKDSSALALTHVGFAGEGTVDDLVVTKNYNTPDVLDFTYTIKLGEGVSSVTYTIGDGESVTIDKETAVEDIAKDSTIVVTATAKDWYKIAAGIGTYTVEGDNTIEVKAEKTANVTTDENGNVTKVEVTENTKPADVGIMTGSFAAAPATELNKALTWALGKGGKTTAAEAAELVSGLNFAAGEEETTAEKAYLLDCTEAELSGEDGEIAKFKFAGFDPAAGTFKVGTVKQVGDKDAYGNGYVEVRGSATVGGAYNEAADTAKHNFFKAFLVPFQPVAAE